MTTDQLPTLKMYYPTYDKEEGVGMYERDYPNGWHSSAEVHARDDVVGGLLALAYLKKDWMMILDVIQKIERKKE